ncbi:DNA-3-methyladenine glycosylase I [bacterium]|nr:DNA-3-methyladenine glycosylase I [bacterium]
MKRCFWVDPNSEIYIKYHDEEWGVPKYDDRDLLELLILESFQAGLSWITVLKKREAFRKAFDNFDINKIVKYDETKISELMNNPGIIRCKNKILSAINNAKIFKEIQKEYGSFSDYIWGFTGNKIIQRTTKELPISTPLSDKISKDLKKRGMKFVGTVIIYSYLQAIGVVNDHDFECFTQKNKA